MGKKGREWGIVGKKGGERVWDIGKNCRSLTIPVLALSQPGKAWWDLDKSGRSPGHSMLTHSTLSHHS